MTNITNQNEQFKVVSFVCAERKQILTFIAVSASAAPTV